MAEQKQKFVLNYITGSTIEECNQKLDEMTKTLEGVLAVEPGALQPSIERFCEHVIYHCSSIGLPIGLTARFSVLGKTYEEVHGKIKSANPYPAGPKDKVMVGIDVLIPIPATSDKEPVRKIKRRKFALFASGDNIREAQQDLAKQEASVEESIQAQGILGSSDHKTTYSCVAHWEDSTQFEVIGQDASAVKDAFDKNLPYALADSTKVHIAISREYTLPAEIMKKVRKVTQPTGATSPLFYTNIGGSDFIC